MTHKRHVSSLILISVLAALLIALVYHQTATPPSSHLPTYQEIKFSTLKGLNVEAGTLTPELEKAKNQKVKIAGFIVPLEDNLREAQEFLLVSNPLACIHVPPPPANQMILTRMSEPISLITIQGPVWIYGTLNITDVKNEFGIASYHIEGDDLEPY